MSATVTMAIINSLSNNNIIINIIINVILLFILLLKSKAPADADDDCNDVAEEERGMFPHVILPRAVVVDPGSINNDP